MGQADLFEDGMPVLPYAGTSGHSRLKEKRNGCKVYVLPNYVNGRVMEFQKTKKCCPNCGWNL